MSGQNTYGNAGQVGQGLAEEKLFKVGELAKAVGKTVRAMHLYEEMGLLSPVSRSQGGYRLYTEEAIGRVQWIARLQDMGFSLPDIQGFLRDWQHSANGPSGMGRVVSLFEAKLAETRANVQRLQQLETDLKESLDYLTLCVTSCAPTHTQKDCGCCDHPGHDTKDAPQLVAGLARSQPSSKHDFDVPLRALEGNRS